MSRLFAVPILAVILLSPIPLHASFLQQNRSIAELEDPMVRSEVLELGGYQELLMEFTTPKLVEVPLFSSSLDHVEFRGDGMRVRIESQSFENAAWVKRSHGHWMLEDLEPLGWSPGDAHARLSRLEVVIDGAVVDLPVDAWVDVFDAPLHRDGLPFAAVMHARDRRRIYVHLQAGDAADARMVTWVIEDGLYRYRVIDPLP